MAGDLPRDAGRGRFAEMEYLYSIEQTFYRSFGEIAAAFARHGFNTAPVAHERLASLRAVAPAANWAHRTFHGAGLIVVKR